MKLSDDIYERVHNYLEQWRHDEDWTDLNVALDRGDTVYAAYLMSHTGAIDDTTEIEREVLQIANEFEKLSQKKQLKYINELFKDCFISSCNECNAVQFLDEGNEELYPEVKTQCWECKSKNIETYYWKKRE